MRIGREAGTTETMSLSLPVEGVQVRLYYTRFIRYKGHPIRDIVYLSEKLRDMTL